ncbi:MAG TPA: NUDIX hydrolase [bacterium]|nr:NUDIX hydrolase [bacterium]
MKIVREETVLKTRIFTVANVHLEKKNGEPVTHAVIRFVETVSILPVARNGDLLLERQFRSAVGGWVIEAPAGKIDPGESPEATVRREVEEEIGQRVIELRELFEGWVSCGYTDEYMRYFVAMVEPIPAMERTHFPDHDEEIETLAVTLDEALAMIDRREIVDAKTIALILAHDREKKS